MKKNNYSIGQITSDIFSGQVSINKNLYNINGLKYGFNIELITNDTISNIFNFDGNIKLNIQKKLLFNSDLSEIEYIDENGFSHMYLKDDNNDYESKSDINRGLYYGDDHYQIVYSSFYKEIYNNDGDILFIADREDNILFSYTYIEGKLVEFKNGNNQGIIIQYNSQNLITKVTTLQEEVILEVSYLNTYKNIKIGNVNYLVYNTLPLTVETKNNNSVLNEKSIITKTNNSINIKKYQENELVYHEDIIDTFAFNSGRFRIIRHNLISDVKMAYIYENFRLKYYYELFDEMFITAYGFSQYKGDVYIQDQSSSTYGCIKEDEYVKTTYEYYNTKQNVNNINECKFMFSQHITHPLTMFLSFWIHSDYDYTSYIYFNVQNQPQVSYPLPYLHEGWNFVHIPISLDLSETNYLDEFEIDFCTNVNWEERFKDVKLSITNNKLIKQHTYIDYNDNKYSIDNIKVDLCKDDVHKLYSITFNEYQNNLINYIKFGNLQNYMFVGEERKLVAYDTVRYVVEETDISFNIFNGSAINEVEVDKRKIKTIVSYYNGYMLVDKRYVGEEVPNGFYWIGEELYDGDGNCTFRKKQDINFDKSFTENQLTSDRCSILSNEDPNNRYLYVLQKGYSYDDEYNLLSGETLETNDQINYTYDSYGRESTVNGLGKSITYTYTDGNLTKLSENGHEYNYTYENDLLKDISEDNLKYSYTYENNKIKTIKENENLIAEYDYLNNDKEIIKKIYKTATSFYGFKEIYDDYGKLLEVYEISSSVNSDGSLNVVIGDRIVNNTYNLPSLLYGGNNENYFNTSSSVLSNSQIGEYSYKYSYLPVSHKTSKIEKYKNETQLYEIEYTYGSKIPDSLIAGEEVLKNIEISVIDKNQTLNEIFTYETIHIEDSLINNIELKKNGDTYGKIEYTYDPLKRVKNKIITVSINKLSEEIKYKTYNISDSTYQTTMINSIDYFKGNNCDKTIDISYDISYNISEIKENNVSKNKYTYDNYNRLIREDNKEFNSTITYAYDNNGNITSKKKYSYTTGELGTPTSTYNYQYGTRLNQLISYNNISTGIDYEGNCTKVNGYNLVFSKGKLVRASNGDFLTGMSNYTFAYDKNGLRLEKRYTYIPGEQALVQYVTNEIHTYTYVMNRLLYENINIVYNEGTNVVNHLEYNYINNELVGFTLTKNNISSEYIYRKNIFGDIVEILDNNLNVVGKYVYDAYGNTIIKTNIDSIASINPFRYRGYYYDVETNLFLVSSRYYSPELCRWISPDDVSYLDLSSVNGLNLYCYCFDDPVNYIDPDGHFPWLVLAIISGVLIAGGATLGGVSAYQSGRDVGTGILEGAFAGAMMAGSMWLMVGSFYVPNGLSSNLGLMMFTYGFNTMAGMTEAGATQIRYSISQGDHWSSNLTRSLAANAPSIYTTKAIPKMLPFATQFSWHIGEKYAYTIPGEGGVFYDYRTTKDAWGMFKNYLGKTPTLFSYGFAAYGILQSSRGIYNSIWGTPNYNKWIVF